MTFLDFLFFITDISRSQCDDMGFFCFMDLLDQWIQFGEKIKKKKKIVIFTLLFITPQKNDIFRFS